MTMPTFHGMGAFAAGTGAIAPAYPADIAADDFALLFCETNSGEAVPAVTGYDVVLALDNSAVSTRLTILSKVLTGGESAPAVGDPGDHVAAAIGVWRGVDPANPIHVLAFQSYPATSAAPAYPGLNTTIDDCMIVLAAAWGSDNVGPVSSNFVNASLANLAERLDEGTTVGGGGGLCVITGEKAAAGPVSISTFTFALSATTFPMAIIALRPARDQTVAGTVTIDGVAAPNGVGVVKIHDVTTQDFVATGDVAGGAGAFAIDVRYDDHDYVAVYDDGTDRGASIADVASIDHDIDINTAPGGGISPPPLGPHFIR